MKTISLKLNVPDWARWLTIDSFGVAECWRTKPRMSFIEPGRWVYGGKRKELMQYNSQSYRGWAKSLRRVA